MQRNDCKNLKHGRILKTGQKSYTPKKFNIYFKSNTYLLATIEFSLHHSEKVTLAVYNLSGRKIASLFERNLESGLHCVTWDTPNITTGFYALRMKTGTNCSIRRISVLR
jgi:hypothetical protein